MTAPIVKGVAKSAQQIAQQTAKQIAQEPFEVAKSAAKQVGAVEGGTPAPQNQVPQIPRATEAEIKSLGEKDKSVSTSRYQSLQKEIAEIGRRRVEKDIEAKQIEEAKTASAGGNTQALVEPVAKRSRNPIKGMAKKLSDLGKRAEIRMPPSG